MTRPVIVRDKEGANQDRGLPRPLPPGERVLWQGRPDGRVLTRRALHLRKLALYLALLVGWCVLCVPSDAEPARAAASTLWLASLGLAALGVIAVIGRLMARSAVYTITDRRVVMRCGVALTVSVNLPYAMIDSASLALHPGGTGDIPLRLRPDQRLGYFMFWPHVRPWRFAQPEPMLRAVPDARRVAGLLAQALASSAGQAPAALAQSEPTRPMPGILAGAEVAA